MLILDGNGLLKKETDTLKKKVAQLASKLGRAPCLVVVLVGEDPASKVYVGKKEKFSNELGIAGRTVKFPADARPEVVKAALDEMNADSGVDGILIQRPLPKQFREDEVLLWVNPEKDVDAFHPETVGRSQAGLGGFYSCTPKGILKLLEANNLSVAGKICCVMGRSQIVGRPLTQLLISKDATVITTHSKTREPEKLTAQADFLFVAIGKPEFIDEKYIKKDAVVVDVGIHRKNDGKLCGDVDFEKAKPLVSAMTPVPGGVGPMTIWGLMDNVLIAAERNIQKPLNFEER